MQRRTRTALLGLAGIAILAGCAVGASRVTDAEVAETMRSSFRERGIAKLDRLDQSELQRQCSAYSGKEMPKAMRERLEKASLAAVKYPADGAFLGDWRRGEAIAQSGRGLQFSDAANAPSGGNCYACHQISKEELSHGNIGPSLLNYGKLRGNSQDMLRYTWARIWDSHSFNACNFMPRYGAAGILTEAQIKDVMALLLDPASPVNR